MYKLDNSFAQRDFAVTVVGCGGTGGFVAEGICRLLPPEVNLVLVDSDRVEERNLSRQNFFPEELGQFKSEALARRLARRFNRPVAYSILPIALVEVRLPGLLISCVDNGPARRDIEKAMGHQLFYAMRSSASPFDTMFISWWVDAGNGENYGQVLIGNREDGLFDQERELCLALPLPTIQRPELLSQALPRERDCVQMSEQGPTINQAMAAVVVEVVRRLIEGTCLWMQLYLDLNQGILSPVPAAPEVVEQITGIKKRKLVKGGES